MKKLHLHTLPDSLVLECFVSLPFSLLLSLRQVSHKWFQLGLEDSVCRKLFVRKWQAERLPDLPRLAMLGAITWRQAYFNEFEDFFEKVPIRPTHKRRVRIYLIGNELVGKTSVFSQFFEKCNKPSNSPAEIRPDKGETYIPTIGVDFRNHLVGFRGDSLAVQLWDCAGAQRFRTCVLGQFYAAEAVLVMFSVTNRHSFESVPEWVEDVRRKVRQPELVMTLIGTQSDADSAEREVDFCEGEACAAKFGCPYIECSTRSGARVDHVVAELVRRMHQKQVGPWIISHLSAQATASSPGASVSRIIAGLFDKMRL